MNMLKELVKEAFDYLGKASIDRYEVLDYVSEAFQMINGRDFNQEEFDAVNQYANEGARS